MKHEHQPMPKLTRTKNGQPTMEICRCGAFREFTDTIPSEWVEPTRMDPDEALED